MGEVISLSSKGIKAEPRKHITAVIWKDDQVRIGVRSTDIHAILAELEEATKTSVHMPLRYSCDWKACLDSKVPMFAMDDFHLEELGWEFNLEVNAYSSWLIISGLA